MMSNDDNKYSNNSIIIVMIIIIIISRYTLDNILYSESILLLNNFSIQSRQEMAAPPPCTPATYATGIRMESRNTYFDSYLEKNNIRLRAIQCMCHIAGF